MTDAGAPGNGMLSAKMTLGALGDLHVREDQSVPLRSLFTEIARDADILILAGDLTDHGRLREAQILAEEIRSSHIPVVGVLGNHDYEAGQDEAIKDILQSACMHVLDGDTFIWGDVGFVGVKGFAGGYGRRMLGAFGEPALKAFVTESVNEALMLESALHTLTVDRVVVILHYSPIAGTLEGEPPEIWPFLGCSRLAETIDRFNNVSAVIHGHAHQGTYHAPTMGGIPVYNVAIPVVKPTGKPYGLITI